MTDYKERLAEKRAGSKMEVIPCPCPLTALGGGWGITKDGSAFEREDGKFFSIIGAMIHGAGREVPGWGQPMLREQGVGVIVLVCDQGGNYLLTMRQEPGNPAGKQYILLGPPLQASMANLAQAHGGKMPPRSELAEHPCVVWADAHGDGGRFIEKTNRLGIFVVPDLQRTVLLPDEVVLTRDEIREAFLAGEINSHGREAIAMAEMLLFK